MRIVSISAKNFHALQEVTIQFGRNYCTLSGKNNAGKSAIITLLEALFTTRPTPLMGEELEFVYASDRTQWGKAGVPIEIEYKIELTAVDDPALIAAIAKLAQQTIEGVVVDLLVAYTITKDDQKALRIAVNGVDVVDAAAKEIDKRIKTANLLFLHNSTNQSNDAYRFLGRRAPLYEFVLSADEKKLLDKAELNTQSKIRKMTRSHTQGLGQFLGRLSEKYNVEATPFERYSSRRMPIGISLRDKTVEVPLSEWGSGTQNRTHILAAVLHASRINKGDSTDEKITPFVVIEEPESFLHPSAQAEFGRLLRAISQDTGIQVIVTTHSPHMLNQEDPGSNLLLARETSGKKLLGTKVVSSTGDSWMAPFADHLGIGSQEFERIKPLFSAATSKVLLVEGPIDQEYFEFLKQNSLQCEQLKAEIEIVAYGGRGTLTNTLLLKFVLERFENLFVTFDLDGHKECSAALNKLGRKEGMDYLAIGMNAAGRECIEGLLPPAVIADVMGKNANLTMAVMNGDPNQRKQAKDHLKKEMLKAFKSSTNYSAEDLKDLSKVVKTINKRLS